MKQRIAPHRWLQQDNDVGHACGQVDHDAAAGWRFEVVAEDSSGSSDVDINKASSLFLFSRNALWQRAACVAGGGRKVRQHASAQRPPVSSFAPGPGTALGC